MRSHLRRTAIALLLAGGLGGCRSNTAPGVHPEIRSLTDSFEFQLSAVTGYSGTLTYPWSNTGAAATINQATAITAGTVTLQLLDAAGQQVYARTLSDNGTFPTTAGSAGTWTVRVVFSNASGTLNFRVQKKT